MMICVASFPDLLAPVICQSPQTLESGQNKAAQVATIGSSRMSNPRMSNSNPKMSNAKMSNEVIIISRLTSKKALTGLKEVLEVLKEEFPSFLLHCYVPHY